MNSFLAAPPTGLSSVGQEDSSLKNSLTKPVEQTSASNGLTLRERDTSLTVPPDEDEASPDQKKSLPNEKSEQELQQEQELVKQLSARDREVRAHEQAHAAVGGQYAGAPSYEFERGPDGVNYAVGGEVPIDVGQEATPQLTIQKMEIVRRAALAPAEPSSQDRRVAAEATRKLADAQSELQVESREGVAESGKSESAGESTSETSPTGLSLINDSDNGQASANENQSSLRSISSGDLARINSNRSLLENSIASTQLQSRSGQFLNQFV